MFSLYSEGLHIIPFGLPSGGTAQTELIWPFGLFLFANATTLPQVALQLKMMALIFSY
ncbi:hypothetical protein D3C85_1692680 [compost metagenome]